MDTISVAKRLQEDFGMPEKQAEGVAVVMHENFVGNVATKYDVKTLNDKIESSVKALDGKIESSVRALNDKMATLATKEDVTKLATDLKWIIRIGGVIVVVVLLPFLKDVATALQN